MKDDEQITALRGDHRRIVALHGYGERKNGSCEARGGIQNPLCMLHMPRDDLEQLNSGAFDIENGALVNALLVGGEENGNDHASRDREKCEEENEFHQ